MEFFTWNTLGSLAGAALAVGILTQLTKEIHCIKVIPTQVWSYLLALIVLILAEVFTVGVTVDGVVLTFFNAAVVSLSANGGYEAVNRIAGKDESEN